MQFVSELIAFHKFILDTQGNLIQLRACELDNIDGGARMSESPFYPLIRGTYAHARLCGVLHCFALGLLKTHHMLLLPSANVYGALRLMHIRYNTLCVNKSTINRYK